MPEYFDIISKRIIKYMVANKRKIRDLLHPELSYNIVGLCFKVHNNLGRYRNEQQYADALEVLFKEDGIDFEREKFLPKSFEGEQNRNKPDFVIEDKIILDLKAKTRLTKEDYYQMRRYLDSGNKELGILVNFRQKNIAPKRILNRLNN